MFLDVCARARGSICQPESKYLHRSTGKGRGQRMTDSLLGNKTHTRKRTHTPTNKSTTMAKKRGTRTREDGGSDRREVKHRYKGDGQIEEEGKPSSRRSPWMLPVIGWYPEDRRDAGPGHGRLHSLAA